MQATGKEGNETRKRANKQQKKEGFKQETPLIGLGDSARSSDLKSSKTPENLAENKSVNEPMRCLPHFTWLWKMCHFLFGMAVACFIGYRYSSFVKLLHENDMWFSEISVSLFCGAKNNALPRTHSTCMHVQSRAPLTHEHMHTHAHAHFYCLQLLVRYNWLSINCINCFIHTLMMVVCCTQICLFT